MGEGSCHLNGQVSSFALSEVSDEGRLMTVLYIATNTLMFMVVDLSTYK